MLENRFGDKQTIISRHIDVLTELPKITSNEDLQQLRRLYDKTECTVRSLRGIGITTEHYSVFLTPIIMKKIPPELRLLLSRKLSNEWDLNGLLKALGEELALREKCAFASSESASGTTKSKPNVNRGLFGNSQPSTSATLMVNNEKQGGRNYSGVPFCLFCGNKHYSSSCMTVTDPNARKKIIREKRRCFVCLRGGHISRDCRSTSKCFRCQGKHHVSICGSHADFRAVDNTAARSFATLHEQNRSQQVTQNTSHNPQNASVSTHISSSCDSSNTAVLLQTARAKVHRVDSENERCNVRLTLNSCSQKSYVTRKLKERLQIPTISTNKVLIKEFGNESGTLKQCESVQIAVKGADNLTVFVNAYSYYKRQMQKKRKLFLPH